MMVVVVLAKRLRLQLAGAVAVFIQPLDTRSAHAAFT